MSEGIPGDEPPGERLAFQGHAALQRLGRRVTCMYLGGCALALVAAAIAAAPPPPTRVLGLLGLLGLFAATGWATVIACRPDGARLPLIAALGLNTAAAAGVVLYVDADPNWA